jgi:GPH family glycoside/pentoside/hexuronide:cation symporter
MQRLAIKEKFGYGLGDTASNIVFQVVINFMLYFYTDVFGITAAAAGTLMLVVRLFDAVTDPIMGGLADRTRTRWGSYRPYLLWVSVPYGLLAVLAFTTPDLSDGGKLIYAYITYALLMTAYTAINIPYSALGGVITKNTQERASVQSWRFMLAMVGGALVAASTLPMVEFFGNGNDQKGFQMAMVVLSVIAIACFVACFALTHERENPAAAVERQSIFADFISLMRNDQWVIIAIVSFVWLISVAMKGGVTPYYVSYYLNSESSITLFMTSGMLMGVAGAMFANWMTRRYCKVMVMQRASFVLILVYTALALVPRDQYMLALVLSMGSSFVHMIIIPYLFSAVADTVDYGLKRWGKGAMAMSYSGHLLALKIGIALGGALSGWILAYVGYQPNVEQTEAALSGIVFLYAWSSAIASVIVFVCFKFYRLNREWAESNELSTEVT